MARLIPNMQRYSPVGAVAAGAALGSVASVNVGFAAAGTIAVAVLLAVGRNTHVLLYLLIGAVFAEIVNVNGVPISRVVAPIALVLLFLLAARGRLAVSMSQPMPWIVAYTLWALASSIWTVDANGTVFLLGSLLIALVYLVSFAGLITTRRQLEGVLLCIAVAAFISGVIAIVAFLTGASSELQLGRAEGGSGDPNFFALYEIMALPLVFVLVSQTSSTARRLFLYATVLVIAGAVITTVSRGGFLTLAVLLVLLLLLPARATVFRSGGQKAVLGLLVLVGVLGSLQVGGATVLPRIQSVFSPESTQGLGSEGRGNGRLNIWLGASTAIKERPLIGLGYGAFEPKSNELLLRTPGVDLTTYDLRPHGQPAHSAYIGTAAELGIPGLVLLLGILISALRALRRTAALARERGDEFGKRVANALVLSLGGWVIASVFLSSETSRILWIALGLTLALPTLLAAPASDSDARR